MACVMLQMRRKLLRNCCSILTQPNLQCEKNCL
uniref:Uncharacterized protein n=1 Tax=Arundo donax TaxID=35708 RepID=A0A0A9EWY1_ARUDO